MGRRLKPILTLKSIEPSYIKVQKVTYNTSREIYVKKVAFVLFVVAILGGCLILWHALEKHSVIANVLTGLASGIIVFVLLQLGMDIVGYRRHRELCEYMILWRDAYRKHTNWWEMRTRRAIMDGDPPHVGATEHEKKIELRRMMDLWAHDINEEYVQTCRYLIASVQALHIPHTQKLEYMSVLCEEACVVREHERDMRRQNMVKNYDEFIYDWFSNKMLIRMGMKNPPVRPEYKAQGDSHD